MASFCTNCGAPIVGRFCTKCGAAARQAPEVQTTASSPVTAPAAGSGLKIILIVAGAVVMLGIAAAGSLLYIGYRAKQKIAEIKSEYAVGPTTAGTPANARQFPPSQGSGCRMLQGQEAAQILGVAVDRVEFDPNGPEGTEMCRYWVSATERQRLMREELALGFSGIGNDDTNGDGIEKIIGAAAGALNEADGDNKNSDFAFSLQVWRKNGQEHWQRLETAQNAVKNGAGADVASVAMQPVAGVGDRAVVLAAGHSIMVLKGDTFFLLGFQQFVPGREKTVALARVVASRL